MEKIKLSNQQVEPLVQLLANATTTFYECGSPSKASWNDLLIKGYTDTLNELDIVIPDLNELLNIGIYNGIGSY